MKTRSVIAFIVVGIFILASHPAVADDIADLKTSNDKYFSAWNASDVD